MKVLAGRLRLECSRGLVTHVTTGEVTTLKHELWDHTVELGASVAEALLASAKSAEVLGGLWDNIVEEVEVDAAGACCNHMSARGECGVSPNGCDECH